MTDVKGDTMKLILPAVIALFACLVVLQAVALVHRDPAQVRHFMKLHPCPGGVDAGSSHRCRGYIVDHVKPLACGGPDLPSNMQWQTVSAAKAKDKVELKGPGCKRR